MTHEPDLLRFTTAGSVDDGKSTLIGRLLYDSKAIFEDQLEQVRDASVRRGGDEVDLSLLTDGLRAEREQKITIDVAYRYFATPKRKFIIADTPGHVQYTRNMVTGASTADLAIVLVDARNGMTTQSRRHGFIASLLRIPHVVVAVNKMDLVDYSQERFEEIARSYTAFASKLGVTDLTYLPISALHGDQVVERSERMPWFRGPTLLGHLESVPLVGHTNLRDTRLPVQFVIRPDADFRGYAGRVASGAVRPGDDLVVLPSGARTQVRDVFANCQEVDEAIAGDSVVVTTTTEVDISRGDMLVRAGNLPELAQQLDATICWMTEAPLEPGSEFRLRHTTHELRARVSDIVHRIDVDTLHRDKVKTIGLNDIARVTLDLESPLAFDPYALNRQTGSFVLIDLATHNTVAGGMIRGALRESPLPQRAVARAERSPNVIYDGPAVTLAEREAKQGHRAAVVWLTGLSGSGKSSIADALERALFERDVHVVRLDGALLRTGLNGDLGFTAKDRMENLRRVAELAALQARQGSVVVCSFVSPYQAGRDLARARAPRGRFFEVHVSTPLEVCEARDSKGLYARARAGELADFTGISAPYEIPEDPELQIDASTTELADATQTLLAMLEAADVLPR